MASALDMLDRLLFGNSLQNWCIALGVASVVFAASLLTRRMVRKRYAVMTQTEQVELFEVPLQVISRTSALFLGVVSLFIGFASLETTARVDSVARTLITIAVFWQFGVWVSTAAFAWIELKRRRSAISDRAVVGTLGIIGVVIRVLIWSIVFLLTLDNLGINVTTLVAGLGIGGIAIALAVQNVLGDLLASLSIALDKPFLVGDFVIAGDFMGTVEYIGIKSTRLRSLSGEQIVMANADLLSSRLRNYGRMQERRVLFTIGVTYETPRNTLTTVSTTIRDIIKEQSNIRFDRCHLAKFGDYSIDFECVYYVLSADYNAYMDIQQQINFRIHEEFEKMAVDFAYPTQRILLSKTA